MEDQPKPPPGPGDGLIYGKGDLPPDAFKVEVQPSALGSFMPEVTYRPVPIAWFLAAWVVHSFSLAILALILSSRPAFYTLATTFLVTIMVVRWTFARGMQQAGVGWRAATVIALALNWLWVALLVSGR